MSKLTFVFIIFTPYSSLLQQHFRTEFKQKFFLLLRKNGICKDNHNKICENMIWVDFHRVYHDRVKNNISILLLSFPVEKNGIEK